MIPIIKPDIAFEDVVDDFRAIIESGRLTSGPYVKKFEEYLSGYVGTRYAFSTTSCTTAMHLSLVAKEIGPGDEVLVADFTFPATGNVVVQTGAIPVLVDCRGDNFEMDLSDARAKLTKKTRAIIVVSPFGQPCHMADVVRFGREHELFVIEDAACALGAQLDGRLAGGWPDVGCFSFHPRKVITAGEGGAIATNDPAIAEKILVLRSHGGKSYDGLVGFQFKENGFNYRLSEIQAAMALEQLSRIEEILADRRRSAKTYMALLAEISEVAIPLTSLPQDCTFQSFVLMLDDDIDRNAVIGEMRECGIETTLGTYALHTHPAFSRFGYEAGDLPNSFKAQNQSLTLPLLANMPAETIDKIVSTLRGIIHS